MFQIYYIFEPFAKKFVSKYIELNKANFQNLLFFRNIFKFLFKSLQKSHTNK